MPIYNPPINEMTFLIKEYLAVDTHKSMPIFNQLSDDLIDPILREIGKVCCDLLLPLNQTGDAEGCTLLNGHVTTPKGFKEAYQAFIQGGWTSLNCDPEYGGQGMPLFLGSMISEMASSVNMSFAMYPGLTHGAYSAIHAYGTAEQKALYLPKLISGEWSGTMNLTEPHCGTDLGMIRTKAIPQSDGSYLITGQKIFISAGEHDLTENIIHLVLARLPDAPEGVKGISLFIVPKFLITQDNSLGARNKVTCGKLEEKMGIHANSTCVMNYDGATGYLVGEAHAGLKAMFIMMNEARLGVGIQGISQSEIAYQNAVAYAQDRIQGRSLSGIKEDSKPADNIIYHPNIRRMLMNLRAFNEGARGFLADIGLQIDISHHHDDSVMREAADDFVSLMTPIAKGYITDKAFELCTQAQQVFGGHGYIKEWGVEQYLRDVRIAMIYEGTNGIQALDLVGRKLPKNGGRAVKNYIMSLSDCLKLLSESEDLGFIHDGLTQCRDHLQQNCLWLIQNAPQDPEQAGAGSVSMMHLFGITILCHSWAKMALIADQQLKNKTTNPDFYKNKLITARYFVDHYVPEILTLSKRIQAGKTSMMALPKAFF